ncbi:hypothetical protein [Martelella alba]|uniref:Uncharacterized protein n=1 Tax=Martelella alba TaxID=2590451 RepID=A0ABY2SQ92_9HYPH|nr:hypothetical protein [Martelella alba]TKI08266.1 hypothetical protein FCN80_03720 [Martelella alba]
MTVSIYGLTTPPDVFFTASEFIGGYLPETVPALTVISPSPAILAPEFIIHSMKKRPVRLIFTSVSDVFHSIQRLSMALKEATTFLNVKRSHRVWPA